MAVIFETLLTGMISLQGIVDAYEFLYDQPPNAWTFELDIKTSLEKW